MKPDLPETKNNTVDEIPLSWEVMRLLTVKWRVFPVIYHCNNDSLSAPLKQSLRVEMKSDELL